jgi:hypothetical protein
MPQKMTPASKAVAAESSEASESSADLLSPSTAMILRLYFHR